MTQMETLSSTPPKKTSTTKKKTNTIGTPTEIRVGPYLFEIRIVDDLVANATTSEARVGDSLYGRTSFDKQLIELDSVMQPAIMKETLLHEILHAIWEVVGGSQDVSFKISEEEIVRKLSPTLLDTFKRNPEVAAYLFGE